MAKWSDESSKLADQSLHSAGYIANMKADGKKSWADLTITHV